MVSPLRRIGKSANQRIGNSRGLVCPRNHISLQRVRNASQPARRFSRINEPRANYPPPWKLSWKYWKVRGVEWLLLVSGTTILLHDGCWATATISNSKYKWKKKKRKKGKKRNTRPKRGIRVNEKEWKLRAWEWNKRSSIVGRICPTAWNQPRRPWDFNGSLNHTFRAFRTYIRSIVFSIRRYKYLQDEWLRQVWGH